MSWRSRWQRQQPSPPGEADADWKYEYCQSAPPRRKSWGKPLRHQLRGTSVRVIELAPPAVSTELHDYMGPKGREIGIPVDAFVAEAMAGLNAGEDEICVGQAKRMRDHPQEAFARLNGASTIAEAAAANRPSP